MISEALKARVRAEIGDPHDQCYTASEALYVLAGGKAAGITPMHGVVETEHTRISHWWLRDEDGSVVDLTADQFDFPWPYAEGRGRGFQTHMKRAARELVERLS
jgi:hypothetical protein